MSVANFEALSTGLCELAGIGVPVLTPDANDSLAFAMRLQGFVVSALELARDRGRRAVFMVQLDAPPEADALRCWSLLLQANAFLPGEDAPHFSRHPETGGVILQWCCRFDTTAVVEAYQQVMLLVEIAKQWRSSLQSGLANVQQPEKVGAAPDHAAGQVEAPCLEASFATLYDEVCKSLHSPPAELVPHSGVYGFTINYAQTEATVVHAPLIAQDAAIVTIPMDPVWNPASLATVTSLMEANFALMMRRDGAVFCMDINGTGLQLQYAFTLADAKAAQLLAQIGHVVEIIREWERVALQPDEAATSANTTCNERS